MQDRGTKAPRDLMLAEAVHVRVRSSAGLSFKTTMGNVLTLTPPLTVTEEEMQRALDIIEDAITALEP